MSVSSQTVKDLRRERGWSQDQLAAISGLSERTIQRIETDGACSLDSKMALASAFGIPPSELSREEAAPQITAELQTDWGGAIGLLICGLLSSLVVMLTATNGAWEIASFSVVIGVTVILSIMSHGASATYAFFDRTSWIVRHPIQVTGLNRLIAHARTVIVSTYTVGTIATIVTALSITIYGPTMLESRTVVVPIILKPVIYAILFSEFWIRPFKRKLQRMLASQMELSTKVGQASMSGKQCASGS